MSWWFYRSGEHGTRELWAIDFDPLLTIFVLLIPVSILLIDGLLSLFLLSCGFVCLLIAKVSLFRRGVWVSWGPRLMSVDNAKLYRVGLPSHRYRSVSSCLSARVSSV